MLLSPIPDGVVARSYGSGRGLKRLESLPDILGPQSPAPTGAGAD